jgi:hypothetical protein
MFGSVGVELLRHVAGSRECQDRSEQRLPLRSDHFPVEASGREILTQQGAAIAVATDPAMSEEIARRLNRSDLERPGGAMGTLISQSLLNKCSRSRVARPR